MRGRAGLCEAVRDREEWSGRCQPAPRLAPVGGAAPLPAPGPAAPAHLPGSRGAGLDGPAPSPGRTVGVSCRETRPWGIRGKRSRESREIRGCREGMDVVLPALYG